MSSVVWLMVIGRPLAIVRVLMWRRLQRQRLNRTTILMVGCVAFLLGLVVSRRGLNLTGWIASVTVLAAVLALKFRTVASIAVITLVGVLLGIWRGADYLQRLQPYHQLALQKVTFTATANVDAVYGQNGQLAFVVRDVRFTAPRNQTVPGTIKVGGFGETMVYRGDRLQISGKLYPTRGANQATVSFAQLHKVGSTTSVIDTVRRKFTAGMQSALPEPLASFGLGLLVGQRNTLPDALTQALLMVGLTHIIAVSGYNLTILLEASRRILGNRSKVLSVGIAIALILGFLLIAGTSASIVRAAVISILGLSTWYYGRTIRPILLILLAAVGTAYANPVYLWSDISWYLSFLAFFGILIVGPLVTRKIYKEKQPNLIVQVLLESFCAELMTIPLVLYIFGQMSLVSLLANMLVTALIPLAMLLSFIAGLAGMFVGTIAGWFAWPALVLLTYMVDVVNLLSRIPHVFQKNHYFSLVDMILCYAAVVFLLSFGYLVQRKRIRFGFTPVRPPTPPLGGSIYSE